MIDLSYLGCAALVVDLLVRVCVCVCLLRNGFLGSAAAVNGAFFLGGGSLVWGLFVFGRLRGEVLMLG